MVQNERCGLLRRVLSAQCLNEITIRVHQVKVDAVVHQIVLSWLDVLRCAEVDAVLLAERFDLIIRAGQTNELLMELAQVILKSLRGITGRIAGDKDGKKCTWGLFFDDIQHGSHLVEFFGADIRASSETEVHLIKVSHEHIRFETAKLVSLTYQGVFALHHLAGKWLSILIDQLKGSSNFWSAHALGRLSYSLTLHARLFKLEVPY